MAMSNLRTYTCMYACKLVPNLLQCLKFGSRKGQGGQQPVQLQLLKLYEKDVHVYMYA